MILSRRAALNGEQLDEIHEAIVIRRIDPGVTKETVQAVSRMGAGSRMTGEHWDTLEAAVTFAINLPKRQIEERRAVFDAAKDWAMQKGWLTTNEMPGRRMYVDKVIIPGGGDMWEWLNEYTIGLRAYNVPFWQDETPAKAVSGTQASGSLQIAVGGNEESVLDATFRNMSGMEINNFWIQANGNRITLSGLGLGGSQTLNIHHGTDGLLRILKGSTDVYEKYTGADDLYVKPGATAVTFQADRAGILTVQNYGRYV